MNRSQLSRVLDVCLPNAAEQAYARHECKCKWAYILLSWDGDVDDRSSHTQVGSALLYLTSLVLVLYYSRPACYIHLISSALIPAG